MGKATLIVWVQACWLMGAILWNALLLECQICWDVIRLVLFGSKHGFAKGSSAMSCVFYEGEVRHVRIKPLHHSFRYKVRMAFIDLDNPPSWWKGSDHSLTPSEIRSRLGTKGNAKVNEHWHRFIAKFSVRLGNVRLLTIPMCAGYAQNPISIYYVYHERSLTRCIAEVTNTPWSERVIFDFDPNAGLDVPKALHVSPFMDMANSWKIFCSTPGNTLKVSIQVNHPQMGHYFKADFNASKSQDSRQSENSSFTMLLQYGYMPHRVAIWIYSQALVLIWKGLKIHSHPSQSHYASISKKKNKPMKLFFYDMKGCTWPWNKT